MFDNLYIHVPFCQSKCGYCAFYSMPAAGQEMQEKYVREMEWQMNEYSFVESFKTVYLGGGTPSSLPQKLFERLFLAVNASFQMVPHAEITVECNPETVTLENAALISAFANRISLGVQSFSPELRRILGRRAGNDDIERAIELFHRYNVERLSVDLIYAVPGQSLAGWLNELQRIVDLGFKHVSCYSLTIEEGTMLAEQHGVNAVDEELSAEMWWATGEFLHKNGLERYEVSNYAVPGNECRHNMNVWHGGTYLGLGPAACSFDGRQRWTQPADLPQWLERNPVEMDELDSNDRAQEIFTFGLRTASGWKREEWNLLHPEIQAALPWPAIMELPKLSELMRQNLLVVNPDHIYPTEQGMAFWDDIGEALL